MARAELVQEVAGRFDGDVGAFLTRIGLPAAVEAPTLEYLQRVAAAASRCVCDPQQQPLEDLLSFSLPGMRTTCNPTTAFCVRGDAWQGDPFRDLGLPPPQQQWLCGRAHCP